MLQVMILLGCALSNIGTYLSLSYINDIFEGILSFEISQTVFSKVIGKLCGTKLMKNSKHR